MKWAISLGVDERMTIEKKIGDILTYIFTSSHKFKCSIFDIDATGSIGDSLTQKINRREGSLDISKDELIKLINEDGQIIELDLTLSNSNKYQIIVRDGDCLDVLGDGESITDDAVGVYVNLDLKLYRLG